jgi:Flp pilus assembly protein TadD
VAAAVLSVAFVAVVPEVRAVMTDDAPAAEMADPDFAAGRAAIERKNWTEAVRLLRRALPRHPDDADLHNALGYAHRNLQQLDLAFQHYKRALALDPRHRGAHEYIGEAYLMMGDLASAEKHLAELQKLCTPIPCEEYKELKRAVDNYKKKK